MNPNEPTRKPIDQAQTGQFLDHTIDSNIHSADPEATIAGSESGAASSSGTLRYSESVGEQIGPYLLTEELGSGGMGTVYRAEQAKPVKREVALKIIKAGMDTNQVIARFEAERQALSLMEHANIARVLDAGATDAGRPYFVMELVRGEPVTRYCDNNRLSIENRLRLFCDICNAIQHAHQKGIIHRDLKPSNILVSRQDGNCVAKIIDFGVAKATNQRLTDKTMQTQQGQVVGTLEYMSPEQAQMTDANVDTRSDIYSLGVVLYELLTGSTPLNRNSISSLGYLDILTRIKDQEAVKPSSRLTESSDKLARIAQSRRIEPRKLSGRLKGDLDWIVLKSLDKLPSRRYESAAAFADDVERFLDSEPIEARPPTNLYLWSKFAKRHKIAVTAGIAVLSTLIAGIFLTTSQWIRAKDAERTVASQIVELQKSYGLEKKNEELKREVYRQNEVARNEISSELRFLVQFGRWHEAVVKFDDFEKEFGELPIELQILKLNVLDALSQGQQLSESIVALEQHPDSQQFDAQLKLWRGYAFLANSDGTVDAPTLIKEAIDSNKLSASKQWFAEGLIEESFSEACVKYRKSLDLAPFDSLARTQLIFTLTLLGRYEEAQEQLMLARTMFPNDARFLSSNVVSHSLASKRRLTIEAVRALMDRTGDTNMLNLRALSRLSKAVHNQFRNYDRDGLLDWFNIMRQGFVLFQEESYRAIPVPEFQKEKVFKAYGQFAESFLNPLMRIASERKKHGLIISNCQDAWKIHPDGMFKCFEGWSWLALKDYKKAAAAFETAVNADGLFPEIRNQGIYGAFLSMKNQYDQSGDSSDLDAAMVYLEKYSDLNFEQHRATTMFEAATKAGRWELAEKLSNEMIDRQGGMVFNWSYTLMTSAEEYKNYGLALGVCDELLADTPNSPLLKRARDRIRNKIAELPDVSRPANQLRGGRRK